MSRRVDVLSGHKERLLALHGCTVVGLARKRVGGVMTDAQCITVFVARKQDLGDPPQAVPVEIEGVPTDVVEQQFGFQPTATDPFARHDPLFGGLSLTPYEAAEDYGSIGCFVAADGTVSGVSPGTYLLTNQHVVVGASDPQSDPRVVQPGAVVGAAVRQLRLRRVRESAAGRVARLRRDIRCRPRLAQ